MPAKADEYFSSFSFHLPLPNQIFLALLDVFCSLNTCMFSLVTYTVILNIEYSSSNAVGLSADSYSSSQGKCAPL